MDMTFRIFRFDPAVDEAPRYQEYRVSTRPGDRILDCLNRIRWEQDGTLAYRMSCAHGVCGSDGMRINGRCSLACQKLVKEYAGEEVIVLDPLPHFKVVKDLVVNMEEFLDRVKRFRPFLLPADDAPEKERLQAPEDRKAIDEVIRCILCGCCTGACPVLDENPDYVGPAALVWAYRYIFDTRDGEKVPRLEEAAKPDAAKPCVNYFECTRSCPKGIPVTKSINLIKREIKRDLGREA